MLQTQPVKGPVDVFSLLNQHLGTDPSPNFDRRAKKASIADSTHEAPSKTSRQGGDHPGDTASSVHDEESASLGKRSLSEFCELRLCGKRKQIGAYVDSIYKLERTLSTLEWLDGHISCQESPLLNQTLLTEEVMKD